MTIRLAVKSGSLKRILDDVQKNLSGMQAHKAIAKDVARHLQVKYHGSKHWNPSKIYANEDTCNVDIAGAGRAYHDVTIKPIHSRSLAIPIHTSAFGKPARAFTDMFVVKKKNGKAFLAKMQNGALQFLYVLKDSVFQRRDSSIMPSDEHLANTVFSAYINH